MKGKVGLEVEMRARAVARDGPECLASGPKISSEGSCESVIVHIYSVQMEGK